ncbi:Protein of unknown function [Pyronema omphalodes CBS 100304]|uniref:Uncharacterized protein n=1 Tax=Pyronema omphalodes (strain CBS 100304) TaxID=1076935 RepID=U4LHT5_PYROM|nr:Protein of unknown function [Pyronema omphalodes CBS 100304]
MSSPRRSSFWKRFSVAVRLNERDALGDVERAASPDILSDGHPKRALSNDWLVSETKKKKRQKIWVSIGLALFAVVVIGGAVAYSVISRNPSVVMAAKN